MMFVPRGSFDINNLEVHCGLEGFPEHSRILQVWDVSNPLKPGDGNDLGQRQLFLR